ncbi:hypothetical protein BKA66DRAFT_574314 [Pyrenochaeta sp. MPI-SDFR-AT-0127]|nr:hypothetical protein BKA66DRAFT_574314 [Pyrenochaeta sp. MPI-SDFR-AT-0127]
MVAALCFYTAYLACQLGGAAHGTGQHREAITDANAQTALRYWFFCEVFYPLATSILKIAVGLFLSRITIIPVHLWIIRIIMVASGVLGIGCTCLVIFQCKPISFWWDLNPNHNGTCLSPTLVTNFTYVVSVLNSFADWTFGTLPIFIVKDLQMKKRMKIVVASVIAFAAIGSTATIIRLPYTSSLKEYKGDFLHRTTSFAIWTTVEVGVGITAGCIATLRPLMRCSLLSFSRSAGQSSGMPLSKHGALRAGMQPLNELRPTIERPIMTTTTTGGNLSSGTEEETFLANDEPPGRWKRGINKNVTTTFVAESRTKAGGPSKTEIRARSGSPGGDSESTLGNEDNGKLAYHFERF